MNIEILPYIDQTRAQESTIKTSNDSDSFVQPALSFDEVFADSQKALAALSVDAAIVLAKQSGLDVFALYNQMANAIGMESNAQNTLSPANITYQSSGLTYRTSTLKYSSPNYATSSNNNFWNKIQSGNDTASALRQPTQSIFDDVANGTDYSRLNAHASDYTGDLSCSDELNAYFDEAAATYGVDVKLLKAVGKTESNFIPDAQSKAGAMGVMQLMPYTADELGVADAFDPRSNILGGAKLLARLLDKYNGDISLAAAAYNAGSGAVDKYGGIPPYSETQNYVNKVLNFYENN